MARKDNQPDAAARDMACPIHKLLGMTPAQVRQELVDEGLDPAAEIEAMRRLGRVLDAKFRPQAERESARKAAPPRRRIPFFRDAVAAGPAEWTTSEKWELEDEFFEMLGPAPEGSYWTRISGDSMRDAGIRDGDCVLVDPGAEPRDGDIVLAHLAGLGQVVKRLRVTDAGIALESANKDFAPIPIVDVDALKIHGVAIKRAGRV